MLNKCFGCKDRKFHHCNQTNMLHKACENAILLFPDYQVTRKSDFLCFATFSSNIVVFGKMLVELIYECRTYTSTLLINWIKAWICYVFYTLQGTKIDPLTLLRLTESIAKIRRLFELYKFLKRKIEKKFFTRLAEGRNAI